MLKILQTLIALFFISSIFGQITFSPEKITLLGNPTEELITFKVDLTNSGAADVQLYWKLEKGENFPTNWATQVCDFQLCYGENIDQMSTAIPNTLKAGETRDFKIYLLPKNMEGDGDLTLTIYDDEAFSNEVVKLTTNQVTVSTTTSIKDLQNNDIKIYPNPSSEYFQMTNDEKVTKVIIYNLAGKTIKELNHFMGKSQNIDFLRSGMYLVRLFDTRSELIKTMRLQKN
jgi:hypothetical protein